MTDVSKVSEKFFGGTYCRVCRRTCFTFTTYESLIFETDKQRFEADKFRRTMKRNMPEHASCSCNIGNRDQAHPKVFQEEKKDAERKKALQQISSDLWCCSFLAN